MNTEFCGIATRDIEKLQHISRISGVMATHESSYEPGAIVPDDDFTEPSLQELRSCIATSSTPDNGTIELIRFTARMKRYLMDHRDTETLPTHCPADSLTTTQNSDNDNLKPGLHLDNKEGRPLRDRLHSTRRIGLNFGPGNRYLLLGTIDAKSLSEALDHDNGHIPTTQDIRSYVTRQNLPPLHCLWLLLPPGHGYIAPTENIVHDGSTHSQKESLIRFWIGAPKPGQLGSAI